jgi:hypothetical protein
MLQLSVDNNRHFVGACTFCAWKVTSQDRQFVESFHATHSCGPERYPWPGDKVEDEKKLEQSESTATPSASFPGEGAVASSVTRKLIPGNGFEGYECDSCYWAWPTPRFIPDGKTGEQMLRDDFEAHKCSEHPGPSKYNDFDS